MNGNRYANTLSSEVSEAEYALILAQEELVVEVQIAIQSLMDKGGINSAQLARLLDVAPARVSQLFSDNAPNLTLRTIAKIFFVLGSKCALVEAADEFSEAIEDQTEAITVCEGDHEWCEGAWETLALSEDAPFAARAVWVFPDHIQAANENHPMHERGSGRSGEGFNQWADTEAAYSYG